jgi:hypothetical protein
MAAEGGVVLGDALEPSHGAINDRRPQSPGIDVRNDARTTALSDQ